MRLDKYIWCVRLFKTRSLATKECDSEKVKLNDGFVKPSKEVQQGDRISIKHPPVWRTYKVLDIPKTRVGAKLVSDLMIETTSEEDLEEIKRVELTNRMNRSVGIYGRPTKRDRRNLDRFRES